MPEPTLQQIFEQAMYEHRDGRLREAEQHYREVLAREPLHAIATHHLGVIADQTGHRQAAVDLLRRAAALSPNWPEAHSDLGNLLRQNGQPDAAIAACMRAIELRPDYPEAYNNLGCAFRTIGRFDDAVAALRKAIALKPNFGEAYNNLGNALRDMGQINEALAALRQAVALKPDYAELHCNLGNTFFGKGQLNEAIAAYQQAIILRPNYAEAHVAIAAAFANLGRREDAIPSIERAVSLKPDSAEIRWTFAWVLLILGDFNRGWAAYDCRFTTQEWKWRFQRWASLGYDLSKPQWNGEDLTGRRILLLVEPGFGDTFQFARYVPMVARRGGHAILACAPEQMRLFQCFKEHATVVNQILDCKFDVHCALGSLPRAFKTTLETIPADVPYLRADDGLIAKWKARMPANRLKIGLVWSGDVRATARRAVTLRQLAPLFKTPASWFVSLQKGHAAVQIKGAPELAVADWSDELTDFAETAALMTNLDLIISSDTSTAHLAGALGRTIWTFLPFGADWRWLLDRADSPWYPTMRLFRQNTLGDWGEVIDRVAQALSAFRGDPK
jgi:tetratricopeptide (TPR) repeat protein